MRSINRVWTSVVMYRIGQPIASTADCRLSGRLSYAKVSPAMMTRATRAGIRNP